MDPNRLHHGFQDPEALQEAASSLLVPLQVTALRETSFQVDVNSVSIGPAVVARIRGTPHVVTRDAARITSTDRDLLKVTLHRAGSVTAQQAGRQAQAAPGHLVVFDTAQPYELAVTDPCDVVVIGLPRAMLGPSADLMAKRTATPTASDTGIRAVIAAFVSGLGDHIDDLHGASGVHLADAMVGLLVAAFTETNPERIDMATGLTDRILAYVLANLGDPDLSVRSVARRHGISTRHLHQLFHRRGHTFAAWIRRQRLQRIRRDLLDATIAGRTTAAIAAKWGLPDASHLARLLKNEYGQTAADIRRGASP